MLTLCNLVFAVCAAFAAPVIHHTGPDLQHTLDAAPPYATILCDRSERLVLSQTVFVRKPVTLRGLNAALPDGLGGTTLIRVQHEGFTFTDFVLTGNAATVDQDVRAALLTIERGDFRVERGRFVNSSKDGVEINTVSDGGDIVGGVLRDLVGEGVVRDVVSISGSGRTDGLKIRNLLVDNIRGIDSRLRGVVEVSDGTDNITVRKVYAERCVYAVDVQDHNKPSQVNTNIVIQDVYAKDCRHAIRTANRPFGHANLTIRDVVAERCDRPVEIKNTNGVTLHNVRILDHTGDRHPLHIRNCTDLSLKDVTLLRAGDAEAGILLQDISGARVQDITLGEGTASLGSALIYRIAENAAFSGLHIRGITAPKTKNAAIRLLNESESGALTRYTIDTDLSVEDAFTR